MIHLLVKPLVSIINVLYRDRVRFKFQHSSVVAVNYYHDVDLFYAR